MDDVETGNEIAEAISSLIFNGIAINGILIIEEKGGE